MAGVIEILNEVGRSFCRFSGVMFVQTSILIALLYIIDMAIRRHVRAIFRYWIWLLVFVKLVLPVSLSSPASARQLLDSHLPPDKIKAFMPGQSNPAGHNVSAEPHAAASSGSTTESETSHSQRSYGSQSPQNIPPRHIRPEPITVTWQAAAFISWLVGVLVLSVLLAQRFLFVKGLIAQSSTAQGQLAEIIAQCTRQAGVTGNIELKLSNSMLSPAACGLRKPVILMPTGLMDNLPMDKIKVILLHELIHIKRGDLWINVAQTALQIIYFYNPMLWFAGAVVRRIREQAVDETVLTKLGDEAKNYSRTLIDIAEIAFSKPHFSLRLVGVVESKKALAGRIKLITDRPLPKTARLGFAGIAAILIFAAVILPMAEAEKPQESTPAQTQYESTQPDWTQKVNVSSDPIPIAYANGKKIDAGKDSAEIQNAIDNAKPGDTVQIKPGTYDGPLTLREGVYLKGEDANTVVIQCDMRVSAALTINECKYVQVGGLTLKHSGTETLDEKNAGNWPVVKIDNSGALLTRLIIRDSASDGILIQNGPKNLDRVTIVDCDIFNCTMYGVLVSGNGNVEFKNNRSHNNKRNGIFFKGDADGLIRGNLCSNNGRHGISVGENAVMEITGNTCRNNEWCGIYYESKSPLNVSNNNCADNGTMGIHINGQIQLTAIGNDCRRNTFNGILLQNGIFGMVSGNTCAENEWHGISQDQYCRPNIENNRCFSNKKCGIYDEGGMLYHNAVFDNGEFCSPELHMYLQAEEFNALEKLADSIRTEQKRFSNGNWRLNYFYNTFATGYGEEPFEGNIALCKKWIARYPSSVTARIVLATAYYWQGWHVRGHGFTNTVSPKAWKPFEEYISKSRETLIEAEKFDVKDPELYALWISVDMCLTKLDELEKVFQKGVAIEPTYYPLYASRCFAYLPKWYGKPGQFTRLTSEAADATKDQIGQSLYFLLAREATRQVRTVEDFRAFGFDYKRIKQGKLDYVKQFPMFLDIENANMLCFMACAANDKEDAKNYFIDIGDQWSEKTWRTEENFKKYKDWVRSDNAPAP